MRWTLITVGLVALLHENVVSFTVGGPPYFGQLSVIPNGYQANVYQHQRPRVERDGGNQHTYNSNEADSEPPLLAYANAGGEEGGPVGFMAQSSTITKNKSKKRPSKPKPIISNASVYEKREIPNPGRLAEKHKGKEVGDEEMDKGSDGQEGTEMSEEQDISPASATTAAPVTKSDVTNDVFPPGIGTPHLLSQSDLEDLERRAGSPLAGQIPWGIANFKFSSDINNFASNGKTDKPKKTESKEESQKPGENPYGPPPYDLKIPSFPYQSNPFQNQPSPSQIFSPYSLTPPMSAHYPFGQYPQAMPMPQSPWSGYSGSPYHNPYYNGFSNMMSTAPMYPNYNQKMHPFEFTQNHFPQKPPTTESPKQEPPSHPYEAIRNELLKAAKTTTNKASNSASSPTSNSEPKPPPSNPFSGENPPRTPFDTLVSLPPLSAISGHPSANYPYPQRQQPYDPYAYYNPYSYNPYMRGPSSMSMSPYSSYPHGPYSYYMRHGSYPYPYFPPFPRSHAIESQYMDVMRSYPNPYPYDPHMMLRTSSTPYFPRSDTWSSPYGYPPPNYYNNYYYYK